MEINPKDKDFWELLIKKIEEEKCILIIGPDVTINNSEKSVNELLKQHIEDKGINCGFYSDDEFFSFPDYTDKEFALMHIQKFFSEHEQNILLERISEIPFHLIISMSPDLILKKLFDKRKFEYSFDYYNKEKNPQNIVKPTAQKPLLYNLFGNIEIEGSVILTYDDIFDYLISIFSKFELHQDFKDEIKAARIILLLGFKFEKWYFKLILRLLNLKEGISHASIHDRKFPPQIKNFYTEEFKIKFLDYNSYEIVDTIYQKFNEKNKLRTKITAKEVEKPEVFISYSWGGESEIIADRIYQTCINNGYNLNIILDKINVGYKGNIKQFMQNIGKGNYIIVIISNKYLRSENCMYEMLEIKNNGRIYDRIFPIVLDDAKIYDEYDRIDYLNFWDEQKEKLHEKAKTIKNLEGTGHVIGKINQYGDIRRIIDEITDLLRNMNTFSSEMHNNNNFDTLLKAIISKIEIDINN